MYLVPSQYSCPSVEHTLQDSPRLICCMIPASQSPGSVSPLTSPPTVPELVRVRLRPRRKGKVHQVGDALLPATTIWILHTGHFSLCILIHESVRCLALRLVFRFRGLGVAWSGVASRRVGADAAVGVCEESLSGGDEGIS